MRTDRAFLWCGEWTGAAALGIGVLLAVPLVSAENLYVDCREGNPSGAAFTSINAAVSSITHAGSATILLRSDCTENVVLNRPHTTIAPEWDACPWEGCTTNGPLATITAADTDKAVINISGADDVSLVHLALSGGAIGLDVSNNAVVAAYGVVAEGNSDDGIKVQSGAHLTMGEGGSQNNGRRGLWVLTNASANVCGQASWLQNKPLVISGNGREGISNHRGDFEGWMGIVVQNNGGWGFVSFGGDSVLGSCCGGETIVDGNQEGGVFLSEGSEISLFGHTTIRNNGSIGVYVEGTGHATFYESGDNAVVVEGHSEVGVNVTAGSQASFHGAHKIRGNGAAAQPWSAGLRVDGNSQAFLEKGVFVNRPEVTGNTGPGVFVDLGSGLDAPSAIFQGNTAEAVRVRHLSVAHLGASTVLGNTRPLVCDNTSLVVTDLVGATTACQKVETRRTVPRPPRPEPQPLQ
jgi:hypothetical protein